MQTRLEKIIKIARCGVLAAISATALCYASFPGCSGKINSADKKESYEQFIDEKVEIEYLKEGPELINPMENLPQEIRDERIRYEQAKAREQKIQENQTAKPELSKENAIQNYQPAPAPLMPVQAPNYQVPSKPEY